MFDKRHRITLLFNANKAYDRQVVEGVGEYLQASQSEWDIFIEEDFRARIDNIKEWLGDGLRHVGPRRPVADPSEQCVVRHEAHYIDKKVAGVCQKAAAFGSPRKANGADSASL